MKGPPASPNGKLIFENVFGTCVCFTLFPRPILLECAQHACCSGKKKAETRCTKYDFFAAVAGCEAGCCCRKDASMALRSTPGGMSSIFASSHPLSCSSAKLRLRDRERSLDKTIVFSFLRAGKKSEKTKQSWPHLCSTKEGKTSACPPTYC